MGKVGTKIKYGFIILDILVAITFLVLSYLEYQKRNDTLKEKDKLKSDYQEILNDVEVAKSEVTEVDAKIEELNRIDERTNEQMEKVIKLASELEKKIQAKETNYKIAYLTFDDGPYYNTYKVLEILKKYDVKATFFTTNINGTKCYDKSSYNCQELYQEYAKAHHTIANHTYTHAIFKGLYKSVASFMDAIVKQEELIKSKTGLTTNIARFPGGSGTAGKLKSGIIDKLRERGYGWVDWTAQDGDGGSLTDKTTGWNNFKNSINSGIEVVLFHDYNKITTNLLPEAIEYLQSKNYILLPLFYDSVMINK